MRMLLFVAVLLSAAPVMAQELPVDVPEMQEVESIDHYNESQVEPSREMMLPRERGRASRDIAAPRPTGQRWRQVPVPQNRGGWGRRIPRRPMRPRYDWYGVCTGPYLVWIGRVQVLVPGNCY